METQTELKTGNPINFSPSGIAYQRDSTDSFLWQFKNNQWIKSTSYGELLSSPPLSSATNRDKRVWSNDEEIKFIVTTEDRKCHEITDRLGSGWNIRSLGSYHWVVGRDTDDYPSLLRVSAGNNQILLELPDKRQVPIHEGPTLNAAPAHGYGRYLCTRQGKTWVAWTKDHNSVGTLSMISEVHHDTGEVAYTWPLGLAGFQSIEGRTESDVHNQPQVIVSPDNYIIVILGAHHGPLYMVKSVNPLSIEEGFWPMERIGIPSSHHRHGYTYPAFYEFIPA